MFIRFSLFTFAIALSTMAFAPAAPNGAAQLPPQPKVHPAGIPREAVLVSPCIATMGEHWASLQNLPTGPIYGVWNGKPVFSEIMVSVSQLKGGFSYANLGALPGYHIDHVDFEYEPRGHAGFPVPHYDLHAYYVTKAEQAKICPSGIPDPAMTPASK